MGAGWGGFERTHQLVGLACRSVWSKGDWARTQTLTGRADAEVWRKNGSLNAHGDG